MTKREPTPWATRASALRASLGTVNRPFCGQPVFESSDEEILVRFTVDLFSLYPTGRQRGLRDSASSSTGGAVLAPGGLASLAALQKNLDPAYLADDDQLEISSLADAAG